MSSSPIKAAAVPSAANPRVTESLSTSTTNTAGMYEVCYVRTVTQDLSDGSVLQSEHKSWLTISATHPLLEHLEEALSVLVGLENGDNPAVVHVVEDEG